MNNVSTEITRVALVTGGAGEGIGSGITQALAREGWFVVVADIDDNAGRQLVGQLQDAGSSAAFLQLDVGDLASIRAGVAATLARYGRIDGLVNSAGVGAVKRVADMSDDDFERILNIDLRGAWRLIREVVPSMLAAGAGSIVNIGSVHAAASHTGWGVYAAAKAGLEGLTRGVAADYGHAGIRCNIVHPGLVDSAQNRAAFARFEDPDTYINRYIGDHQMLPLLLEPDDIGRAVAFLLGDSARGITAASLTVDAGNSRMLFGRDARIVQLLDEGSS